MVTGTRSPGQPAANLRRNPVGLFRTRAERLQPHRHRIVGRPGGHQLLADARSHLQPVRVVVPDQPVGRVQDRPVRAIVAPQDDLASSPVAILELEDVADRRAAEAVDRLIVVADDGHITVALGEQRDEFGLGTVGVLELVDEHKAKTVLEDLACCRRGAQ